MLDKEKDLRINELLKKITTISKAMPEIVFTYYSNIERKKNIKPFYKQLYNYTCFLSTLQHQHQQNIVQSKG